MFFDKHISNKLIDQHIHITSHNIISYTVGALIGGLYLHTRHWVLNNIIGICFSLVGIMFMKVSNYRILCVLLWLLFVYDIVMVFKSDMMITVAKNLDVPVKLILPNENRPSIIGLGDIVLPGILVTWALKFDVNIALKKWNKTGRIEQAPSYLYFWTSLVAYMLGIVSTFISMRVMDHAQPALLYLVPWTTLSVLGQAIYQRQFKKFWKFESRLEEVSKKSN